VYEKILKNQARCKKCGDAPVSAHVHDYRSCKCGAMAVDGGKEYIRRSAEDFDFVEELSVFLPQPAHEVIVDAIVRDIKNNRSLKARYVALHATKSSLRWVVISEILQAIRKSEKLRALLSTEYDEIRRILEFELVGEKS
jgi:hypothetical protein